MSSAVVEESVVWEDAWEDVSLFSIKNPNYYPSSLHIGVKLPPNYSIFGMCHHPHGPNLPCWGCRVLRSPMHCVAISAILFTLSPFVGCSKSSSQQPAHSGTPVAANDKDANLQSRVDVARSIGLQVRTDGALQWHLPSDNPDSSWFSIGDLPSAALLATMIDMARRYFINAHPSTRRRFTASMQSIQDYQAGQTTVPAGTPHQLAQRPAPPGIQRIDELPTFLRWHRIFYILLMRGPQTLLSARLPKSLQLVHQKLDKALIGGQYGEAALEADLSLLPIIVPTLQRDQEGLKEYSDVFGAMNVWGLLVSIYKQQLSQELPSQRAPIAEPFNRIDKVNVQQQWHRLVFIQLLARPELRHKRPAEPPTIQALRDTLTNALVAGQYTDKQLFDDMSTLPQIVDALRGDPDGANQYIGEKGMRYLGFWSEMDVIVRQYPRQDHT